MTFERYRVLIRMKVLKLSEEMVNRHYINFDDGHNIDHANEVIKMP